MPEFSKSIQETRGNRFMENLANHIVHISSDPVADVQRKPPKKKEDKKEEDKKKDENKDKNENGQLTERSELGTLSIGPNSRRIAQEIKKLERKPDEDKNEDGQLTERFEMGALRNTADAERERKRKPDDLSTYGLEMKYFNLHEQIEHLGNRDPKLSQELKDVSKQLFPRLFSGPSPRTISLFTILMLIILIISYYLKIMQCIEKPDEHCY
jgi:hypothetical protein